MSQNQMSIKEAEALLPAGSARMARRIGRAFGAEQADQWVKWMAKEVISLPEEQWAGENPWSNHQSMAEAFRVIINYEASLERDEILRNMEQVAIWKAALMDSLRTAERMIIANYPGEAS